MKIVYINSVYKKGSTGKIVSDLHNYCSKNAINSFVLYGRGRRVKEPNIYKISYEFFSRLNVIRSRITGMVYSGNFFATKKAIHLLKKINPDIVHIHNLNDQYINEYKLLKYLATHNIKTVVTLHSEQMYTGSCGYSLECEKWRNSECSNCPHLSLSTGSKRDNTRKAFIKLKKTYSFFKRENISFISCTPWLNERAKESVLLKRFKSTVIFNGGDETCFKLKDINRKRYFEKYNINEGNKIILFVNPRLSDHIKGHQFINSLANQLPNDYKILIIGKIVPGFKTFNNTKIIYAGEITDKNILAEYYNFADVTIMLSKRECFPMVIVESLLCGTPVVSFKCLGPDNCYNDVNYVRFCEYGNIGILANNILDCIEINKTEIFRYAHNFLSSKIMCENYLDYYFKI